MIDEEPTTEQPTTPLPPVARPTGACIACGAALASDQRYCLHCGTCQGEPRVPYRELIRPAGPLGGAGATHAAGASSAGAAGTGASGAPPPGVPAAGTGPAGEARPPRDWTPLVTLGGLAALALVLVVGVLIGRNGVGTQETPAPQVIRVEGGAPAATTPAAAPESTTDTATRSRAGRGDRGGARGDGGGADSGAQAPAAPSRAPPAAVRELEDATGEDYQRKSRNLPDTLALPGKPPPRDNAAPGGGSEAETIG
jgi:hypothetical protein